MRSRQEEEKLIFGTWNVRTLLDRNENTERPECRTAIVARELGHLGIDIAALSETRLSVRGTTWRDRWRINVLLEGTPSW